MYDVDACSSAADVQILLCAFRALARVVSAQTLRNNLQRSLCIVHLIYEA